MTKVRWDSQPLDAWGKQYANGKFLTLDGHQTHYLEQGENANDPVILVHGFFYDSFMWASNIDSLAANHKVYAPDLWGFGYSTRDLLEYSYALYEKQLLLFMDKLGIEKASLVGQSMGGGIAIQFAVNHPEKVNKLILIDAAGMPNKLPLSGKMLKAFPAMGRMMYGMNTDMMRKQVLADFFIQDKKLISQAYFENVTRFHKVTGTTNVMLSIMQRDFFYSLHDEIHQLAKLDKEILIVWGKHDKGNPLRLGEAMNEILSGSRLEVFETAKHVPNSECPEQFNALATAFLST